MANPLQKYFRQPKIYISLPSKGMFYPEGALIGDYSNVPIFGMTGMDELIAKTPDALFSGESTIRLIESCCPYIKDGGSVPSLDIDALLVAIRIATNGETITLSSKCSNCNEENNYELDLGKVLEHYSHKEFNSKLQLDELIIDFRPLSYSELSAINVENFKLQKMLGQVRSADLSEEDQQKHINEIYTKLAEIQLTIMLSSIESITTPTEIVTSKEYIKEWIANSVKQRVNLIKEKLESIKSEWAVPSNTVTCSECGHTNTVDFVLDYSNFFV